MKRFAIKTNEDYTLSVYFDGVRKIESLTLTEATRLRDSLTRELTGARVREKLCRRQWKKTVDNDYRVGSGQPLRISKGVDKNEHYIFVTHGRKDYQFTVEGFIENLAEKDREKAREVLLKK